LFGQNKAGAGQGTKTTSKLKTVMKTHDGTPDLRGKEKKDTNEHPGKNSQTHEPPGGRKPKIKTKETKEERRQREGNNHPSPPDTENWTLENHAMTDSRGAGMKLCEKPVTNDRKK